MVKISEDFILQLKSLCDIVSIFSSYVDLKSLGKNKKCSCPFHSEKTPSMVVYEDTQSFYCFGCGVGGDVITFIEKIENLNYVDAVKLLADRVGLSVPTTQLDDKISKQRSRILQMNKIAARFFFNNLRSEVGFLGREYFAKRGLSKDIIVRCLKGPSCISAKEKDNSIEVEVEKELGIEIVGDTKVKIAIEDDEEPWDEITSEEDEEQELDNIDKEVKEDYLKEEK